MGSKFELDKAKETLIIHDNYKSKIGWLTFLFLLNVTTSLIILYVSHFNLQHELNILYAVNGSISLIAIIWFWQSRVTDRNIPLHNILRLKTKNILGGHRFTIVLKNGKRRDINLDKRNYFNELENLKTIFIQKNIPVN